MRSVSALLLVVAIAVPSPAGAWCPDKYSPTSKNAAYPTLPVKYRISNNLTDTAIIAAIDAAFATWGGVQCSKLKFTKEAGFAITAPFTTATDGVSIYWVTAQANWPAGVDPKYYTYNYRFFDAQQNLTGAHLAINAFNYAWNTTGGNSTTFDVQNALTALIGQVIGLTHSNTPGSVMYGDPAFGETARKTLSADDQNAIKYLYPAGGSCTAAPGPDPTCGTTPPKDTGTTPKDTGTTPGKDTGTTPGKDTGTTPGKDTGTTPGADTGTTPGKDYQVTPGQDGPGKKCTSSGQCASDEVCVVEGYCKKTGGSDGGCGCEIGARGAPALGLALLAIGALLLVRRRR